MQSGELVAATGMLVRVWASLVNTEREYTHHNGAWQGHSDLTRCCFASSLSLTADIQTALGKFGFVELLLQAILTHPTIGALPFTAAALWNMVANHRKPLDTHHTHHSTVQHPSLVIKQTRTESVALLSHPKAAAVLSLCALPCMRSLKAPRPLITLWAP